MAYEFYLGIDAFSRTDGQEPVITTALIEKTGEDPEAKYRLHDLWRQQDGDHDAVIDRVSSQLASDPFVGRTVCVVNVAERPGQELQAQLQAQGLSSEGIVLTGGDASGYEASSSSFEAGGTTGPEASRPVVSEHEAVHTLDEIYHQGRLETGGLKSEGPSELVRGLEDYLYRGSEAGQALEELTENARRTAANADLVLAAAIACWVGEDRRFDPTEHLGGDLPTTGKAKRRMRPDTVKVRRPETG